MKQAVVTVVALCAAASPAASGEYQVEPYCDNETPEPEKCVLELVSRWEHRDGAAFWEVGTALSDSFCAHPKIVLGALSNEPANLDSWVDRLPAEHRSLGGES